MYYLSLCVAYFWSLQTEYWANRFAKCLKMFHLTCFLTRIIRFWHFSSAAFIEKTTERVPMASNYYYRYTNETIYVLGRMSAVSVHSTCSVFTQSGICVVSSQRLESSPSPSRGYPESESSRKSFKLATRVGPESSRCDSSQLTDDLERSLTSCKRRMFHRRTAEVPSASWATKHGEQLATNR